MDVSRSGQDRMTLQLNSLSTPLNQDFTISRLQQDALFSGTGILPVISPQAKNLRLISALRADGGRDARPTEEAC
jgi:hypothetical protein